MIICHLCAFRRPEMITAHHCVCRPGAQWKVWPKENDAVQFGNILMNAGNTFAFDEKKYRFEYQVRVVEVKDDDERANEDAKTLPYDPKQPGRIVSRRPFSMLFPELATQQTQNASQAQRTPRSTSQKKATEVEDNEEAAAGSGENNDQANQENGNAR